MLLRKIFILFVICPVSYLLFNICPSPRLYKPVGGSVYHAQLIFIISMVRVLNANLLRVFIPRKKSTPTIRALHNASIASYGHGPNSFTPSIFTGLQPLCVGKQFGQFIELELHLENAFNQNCFIPVPELLENTRINSVTYSFSLSFSYFIPSTFQPMKTSN